MAGRMSRAVGASLRSIPIRAGDAGARQIVKEYARLLDEATDPVKAYAAIGPKLTAALRELAAPLPAAGPAAAGEQRPPAVIVRDELRERRRTRVARAAAVDAAAP